MTDQAASLRTESGVQALVARLRDQGVEAGRQEAARLVAEAQAHAREILEKAETRARAQAKSAQAEADALRRGGEEALRIAARDTVLALKEQLSRRFAEEVGKAVSAVTRDETLLRALVLEVAGQARVDAEADKAAALRIDLPRRATSLEALRREPEDIAQHPLTHLTAALAADMLRPGVSFGQLDGAAGGIRVQLLDRGISVDLTDEAVAEALMAHLQPRFRALLEGTVR